MLWCCCLAPKRFPVRALAWPVVVTDIGQLTRWDIVLLLYYCCALDEISILYLRHSFLAQHTANTFCHLMLLLNWGCRLGLHQPTGTNCISSSHVKQNGLCVTTKWTVCSTFWLFLSIRCFDAVGRVRNGVRPVKKPAFFKGSFPGHRA